MTFSEQIVYGFFKPAKYKEMLELRTRRFVLYIVVMMLGLSVLGFVMPTAAIISDFKGFEHLFTKSLGQVEYADGSLSVENNLKMKIAQLNFYVDTEQSTVSNASLNKQGAFVAVGSETVRFTIVVGSRITDYAVYRLSDYVEGTFNNQDLVEMIPYIYGSLFVSFLFTGVGYFLKYAFVALLLSLIANSMNKQMNLHLSFGEVFAICFYGQSFAMVLSNLNLALGLLPSFLVSLIGIFVTVHMITVALATIKVGYDV